MEQTRSILKRYNLATICDEARCPNMSDCFTRGTATFLILGRVCTRSCLYCSVNHGLPASPDPMEPLRVSMAVRDMKVEHAVITSVTRDDLADKGAGHFIQVIRLIRENSPGTTVEILVPDFSGADEKIIRSVLDEKPDVFNHNIEVVRSLFPTLRPSGDYHRSLALLRKGAENKLTVKSGLMIGLGENVDDIIETLTDLRENGCDAVTIGQYLKSKPGGLPVARYYTPAEFDSIADICSELGFKSIMSFPFSRSSFHADTFGGCKKR